MWQEYGFGNSELPTRNATKLHMIPVGDLEGMATENVSTCETLLSTFSRRAVVSKYRNKQFSAKGICDDIVLFQSKQSSTSLIAKKIHAILNVREKSWTDQQTKAKRENSEENATRIHDEYVKKTSETMQVLRRTMYKSNRNPSLPSK